MLASQAPFLAIPSSGLGFPHVGGLVISHCSAYADRPWRGCQATPRRATRSSGRSPTDSHRRWTAWPYTHGAAPQWWTPDLSRLCPKRLARGPRLCGSANRLLDVDQDSQQRDRRLPWAEQGSGSVEQLLSGLCPEQPRRARVPLLRGPARGLPDVESLWIKTAGNKSVVRRRQSGALGVQSSSPSGCARSGGQGSHSCVDRPAACWVRIMIRASGSKSAARRRRSGARGV